MAFKATVLLATLKFKSRSRDAGDEQKVISCESNSAVNLLSCSVIFMYDNFEEMIQKSEVELAHSTIFQCQRNPLIVWVGCLLLRKQCLHVASRTSQKIST